MRPPNLITDHSREEKALGEAGVTNVSKKLGLFLMAAFVMSICGVALLWILDVESGSAKSTCSPAGAPPASANESALQTPGKEAGILARLAATNAWLKQRLKACERALEENSPLTHRTLPWLQAFSCRFLGHGNEKVYVGREGWLFYRPDVDHLLGTGFLRERPGNGGRVPDPLPALVRFKEDLAARGIRLLVVPVPSKPAIAPGYLSPRFSNAAAPLENPSYPLFLQLLRSNGIGVLDLSPPLAEMTRSDPSPCFLRTDTHWRPDGMERAAALVAAKIGETPQVPSAGSECFHRAPSVTVTNRGDLAVMLKLPPDTNLYPPETVTIHPVVGPDGKPWQPAASPDVLVLGDSFARIYSGEDLGWGMSAGFAEQLSFFLQRPVDLLAINAGGASTTRQALARAPERLNGVRTVVYEFAMRELTSGDWRVIPLPSSVEKKPLPDQAPRRINGTIAGITVPPSPGASPYRDVITCLYLKDVSGTGEREILVFLYGMRNNALTGASTLHEGQTVYLQVVPWSTKEAELGSIQRIEPSGREAELEGVYWSDDYSRAP